MRYFGQGILAVKRDVFFARAMTDFTRDSNDNLFMAVLISSARNMFEPRIVAFHAPNRHVAGIISPTMSIKRTGAPFASRGKPDHRKFKKPFIAPSEIDFVVSALSTITE